MLKKTPFVRFRPRENFWSYYFRAYPETHGPGPRMSLGHQKTGREARYYEVIEGDIWILECWRWASVGEKNLRINLKWSLVVFITSNYTGNSEIMQGCKDAGIPAFGTLWDFVSPFCWWFVVELKILCFVASDHVCCAFVFVLHRQHRSWAHCSQQKSFRKLFYISFTIAA